MVMNIIILVFAFLRIAKLKRPPQAASKPKWFDHEINATETSI